MPRKTAAALLASLILAPAAAGQRELAAANNAFALDLYGALRNRDGNLFYSPYSILVTLAMARQGAAGETAVQMDRVLHLDGIDADAFGALARALRAKEIQDWSSGARRDVPAYELHAANAVWVHRGVPLLGGFRGALTDGFGAPPRTIDFGDSAAARAAINAWVEAQTRKRIRDIVPRGMPKPDTKLALGSAIYFKAQWHNAFVEGLTDKAPFQLAGGGESVDVPMMRKQDTFAYAATAEAQLLELPYQGGDLAMVVVLPKKRGALAALEPKLTARWLGEQFARLRPREVKIDLPRFRFTRSASLVETLRELGMSHALSRGADFSRMTGGRDLYLAAVLHKAFVAVDERGTEAAAATIGLMEPTSAAEPVTPVPFKADHPFAFFIRHRPTGCLLFCGRVSDPRG